MNIFYFPVKTAKGHPVLCQQVVVGPERTEGQNAQTSFTDLTLNNG